MRVNAGTLNTRRNSDCCTGEAACELLSFGGFELHTVHIIPGTARPLLSRLLLSHGNHMITQPHKVRHSSHSSISCQMYHSPCAHSQLTVAFSMKHYIKRTPSHFCIHEAAVWTHNFRAHSSKSLGTIPENFVNPVFSLHLA